MELREEHFDALEQELAERNAVHTALSYVADRVLGKVGKILCIDASGKGLLNSAQDWSNLDPRLRRIVSEGQYGEDMEMGYGGGMRHALGLQVDDDRFINWSAQDNPNSYPDLSEVVGVVSTASAAMLSSGEPWMLNMLGFMNSDELKGKPFIGICFGHQALAKVADETRQTEVRRMSHGIREFGTSTLRRKNPSSDIFWDKMPNDMTMVASHSEAVYGIPQAVGPDGVIIPIAENFAENGVEGSQALSYSNRPAWTIQLHPEATVSHGLAWLGMREKAIQDEINRAWPNLREDNDAYTEMMHRYIGGTSIDEIRDRLIASARKNTQTHFQFFQAVWHVFQLQADGKLC